MPVTAEVITACGAEPGHDDEIGPPDAGDHVPVAAAPAAVGGGAGRHVPGEPASVLYRRGRAGDLHRRGPGYPGDPGRTAETAAAAGLEDEAVRGALADGQYLASRCCPRRAASGSSPPRR